MRRGPCERATGSRPSSSSWDAGSRRPTRGPLTTSPTGVSQSGLQAVRFLIQQWTYTFEEVPGGTRLTRAVEGEPGGFFKLADPLIERALKRQVKADLETLKDLLEAQG